MKANASDKPAYFKPGAVLPVLMMALMGAVVIITVVMLNTPTPLLSNYNSKVNSQLFIIGGAFVFMLEMFIPAMAEKLFKIRISPVISCVFILHCFGGTFLGNVANMYHILPHFDTAMHFMVGLNLGMLGLALVQYFIPDKVNKVSPGFIAAIIFFTAIALSTFWEVFEFTVDVLLDMNMQGYARASGELLAGQAALMDTMVDTVLDIAGAAVIAVPAYISIKYGKNWHTCCKIEKWN